MIGYARGRGRRSVFARETATTPYEAAARAPRCADPDVLDADDLEELGEQISTLAAHLHAGQQQQLSMISLFDRGKGWKPGGHRTCAHWLAVHTGCALHVAREQTRVAAALTKLPRTDAAMARGALSFCQVREVTRAASPESEADLLELAEGCTQAVLRRQCRAWKTCSRKDEAGRERERRLSRRCALYPVGNGMHHLDALLPSETAASLRASMDRAGFELYKKRRAAGEAWQESPAETSRRRADELGMVAEWALSTGYGAASESDDAACCAGPISGTRAERYQVMLHVEPATLSAEGEPGLSELADGTRLPAETARRLSCDAGLVRVERSPEDGSVLNVGRRTRTIPPALRRALEVRDRGCRFPGCGLRFTDAHHVVHWADGGETSLRNTLLLCRHHHRLVHEEGWRIEWWGRERQAAFRDPKGTVHIAGARRPPRLPPDPVATLVQRNRERGVEPDARTAAARWKRERDIPDPVFFQALEAALPMPP